MRTGRYVSALPNSTVMIHGCPGVDYGVVANNRRRVYYSARHYCYAAA
jgi:hypothetical protein